MMRRACTAILITMLWAMVAHGQVNTVEIMRVGENAMYYHDYLVAMHYFNIAIDAKPWLAEPYCKRGICKLRLGDYAGAETDLTKALDRHPYVKGAHEARATARHVQGKLADAIVDYDSALINNPKSKLLNEGRRLALKGDALPPMFGNTTISTTDTKAEPLYTLSFYTDDSELHHTLDLPREIEMINRSQQLRGPLFALAHPPIINDEPTLNYHEYSIDYYTRYFVDHSPRAIDLFGRGMDYYTLHNYAEAIADFSRAIKLDSCYVAAYLMRGVSEYKEAEARYARGGEDDKLLLSTAIHNALANMIKTTELSPNMAIGWYNRGVLEMALGNYQDAEASLDKAINLKRDMSEAYFNRGVTRLKIGKKTEAQTDLSRAGELGIIGAYVLLRQINNE